jgi:hypothetical protein
LTKKQTQASRKAQEDALDFGVRICIDDDVYEIRAGDLNALDSLALKQQVGMTFPQLVVETSAGNPDLVEFAAIIWLARRLAGERDLPFTEVAKDIDYRKILSAKVDAAEGEDLEDAGPEA